MAVDAGRFRELFGSFPTTVSIVTTVDGAGEPRGFTCNAVSAVSVDPPLLLVCVDKGSRTACRPSSTPVRFVVHVLADGGQDASGAVRGESRPTSSPDTPGAPPRCARGAPVLRRHSARPRRVHGRAAGGSR
ncbi:flavin reductase family protein [Streptomyces sp. L7]